MSQYRKFILAGVGAAAAILGRHFGLDSWQYLDAVSVATAFGVWAVPNTPPTSP